MQNNTNTNLFVDDSSVSSSVFVYTYRYTWCIKGDDLNLYFKIVSDIEDGISRFENELKNVPGISRITREYLSQIDVSRMASCDILFDVADKDI